jgi:hypothetical protein
MGAKGGKQDSLPRLQQLLPVGDGPVQPVKAPREDWVAEEDGADQERDGLYQAVRRYEEGEANEKGQENGDEAKTVDFGGEQRDGGESAAKMLVLFVLFFR